jgi:hypothetical protein
VWLWISEAVAKHGRLAELPIDGLAGRAGSTSGREKRFSQALSASRSPVNWFLGPLLCPPSSSD